MKIALINYVYSADCSDPDDLLARYATLRCWAEALLAAGASEVAVGQRFGRNLSMRRKGVMYHFSTDNGGPTPRWHTRPMRLHGILARMRPDIAHLNGLLFPAQTWLLRRALPKTTSLLVQDHAGVVPTSGDRQWAIGNGWTHNPTASLRRAIWRNGLHAADGFLFASSEQAAPWRAAGLIGKHQKVYEVMEGSTQLCPIGRLKACRLSGLHGDPAILWVGRLDANKDPLTVLDGFAIALKQLPDAHLSMIYGSDELLPDIQARLGASPSLAAHVHMIGRVDHAALAAFYSTADIFVLGSRREGSGYALIEALACGATPVVTDIPSFRTLTGNGRIGVLWPVGDSAAFAHALVVQSQRDLAAQRATVINHFANHWSWSAIGKTAMKTYKSATCKRKNAT